MKTTTTKNIATYNGLNPASAASWLLMNFAVAISAVAQLAKAGTAKRSELAADDEGSLKQYEQAYLRLGLLGLADVSPLGGKDTPDTFVERTYKATAMTRRINNAKALRSAIMAARDKAAKTPEKKSSRKAA